MSNRRREYHMDNSMYRTPTVSFHVHDNLYSLLKYLCILSIDSAGWWFRSGQVERFISFSIDWIGWPGAAAIARCVDGRTTPTGGCRRSIATGRRCRLSHHFLPNFTNFQLKTRFGWEYVLVKRLETESSFKRKEGITFLGRNKNCRIRDQLFLF